MRRSSRFILVAVVLGLAVGLVYYRSIFTGAPSAVEFQFNQSRYRNVVERVSAMEFSDSTPIMLSCDRDWSLQSLQPHQPDSRIWHQVAARKLADGRLIVTLITMDNGHFGRYGYIYCSGPLRPGEIGPDSWSGSRVSIHEAADAEWWVEDSLPGNWWVVSNNLD